MGAETAATAVAVGATVADGEADGADTTLFVAVSVALFGEAVTELGIVEALGDT